MKNKSVAIIGSTCNLGKELSILYAKNNYDLILIARNKKKNTTGIITDGQIRKLNSKNIYFDLLKVKDVMTKNPIKIEYYLDWGL